MAWPPFQFNLGQLVPLGPPPPYPFSIHHWTPDGGGWLSDASI